MDTIIKEELTLAGIDVDTALARFMNNEKLFQKMLYLFLEDTNFQNLLNQLQAENYTEAYKATHTLKGLCGNLALENLFTLCSTLCIALKENNINTIASLIPSIIETHTKLTKAIQKWN